MLVVLAGGGAVELGLGAALPVGGVLVGVELLAVVVDGLFVEGVLVVDDGADVLDGGLFGLAGLAGAGRLLAPLPGESLAVAVAAADPAAAPAATAAACAAMSPCDGRPAPLLARPRPWGLLLTSPLG